MVIHASTVCMCLVVHANEAATEYVEVFVGSGFERFPPVKDVFFEGSRRDNEIQFSAKFVPNVDGLISDFPGIRNVNRPEPVRHRFFKRVEEEGLAIDRHVFVEGEGAIIVDINMSPQYVMIFSFAESCSFPDVEEMCIWVEGRKDKFGISCIQNI